MSIATPIGPTLMKNPSTPDSDHPLTNINDDLFGFVEIARRITPAVLKTLETDGMVIGLEGPWGSGKTTLLNYLRSELEIRKPKNIHIISIAPWLNGDISSLVSSLISPISEILDKMESSQIVARQGFWGRTKKASKSLGAILRDYGAKTGRILTPAARFAEYFVPGSKIVADGLETSARYLEDLQRNPTTAEEKTAISQKLSELDVGFIVILDDLDRLDPAQAVEVVRLVRSVADFPKITYIMCYDRSTLSHALQTGLNIIDGDFFLQKIIQLTFTMPLPESFDMRELFFNEAKDIFQDVNGNALKDELITELKSAIDSDGAHLKTPREVKIALNSLRFLYPSVKNEVYFPDMCRINLIKTTRPNLYKWIEEYLTSRSIVITDNATISDDSKKELGDRLKSILPGEAIISSNSIYSLRQFIPGVIKSEDSKKCVFNEVSMSEARDSIENKRLGSPLHYRNYFALTYPKTVMTDEKISELIDLAAKDPQLLSNELIILAKKQRSIGKNWFIHVLDRLDWNKIDSLDSVSIAGIIVAITDGIDAIISEGEVNKHFLTPSTAQLAEMTVIDCLKKLKKINQDEFSICSKRLATTCKSMNWLVGYFFRSEIHRRTKTDGGLSYSQQSPFEDAELVKYLDVLRKRTRELLDKDNIPKTEHLAAYLFGWRDLSGPEEPKLWVERHARDDIEFLCLLNRLRSWAMSDKIYYPLHRSTVEAFLDWDETLMRIEHLISTEHREKAMELKLAIEQGRN